ncbi:unnamed protein product [Toxocara canis]|uniref:Transposase n=1 Tax=Toxocara canis TaxID=6265 RepID=A0A183UIZ0_TOXCA|nr:unnamed protein product [Toxocara canis]
MRMSITNKSHKTRSEHGEKADAFVKKKTKAHRDRFVAERWLNRCANHGNVGSDANGAFEPSRRRRGTEAEPHTYARGPKSMHSLCLQLFPGNGQLH